MAIDINIHVTGLDKLADGILALAKAAKGKSAPANPSQAPAGSTAAGARGGNAASAGTSAPAAPSAAYSGSAAASAPAPALAVSAPAPAPMASAPASVPAVSAPAAPAGAPMYTKDDLAQPAGTWMSADPANRMPLLSALNTEFGIMGLDQLPPEQYGAYALRLRQLGVAI